MTQSYQVLARKYRPTNFSELIGQEILVTTLSNAIAHKKIAHSFILTGIRGVGKTTTARIIAKALNCTGEDNKSTEPKNPCGLCSNCISITSSRHQDVIEIDAASKTGVDDIRAIIDNVSYAPAIARYKVYIIDEVHMLSNNAFNALLKTLEEPPSHVKFIFATTEIRKVPITVLSRCQRFDLRRLSLEELSNHLQYILKQEGFECQNEALNLIAEAADGSVRDLLSITDRILSHSNYQPIITDDLASQVLGLSDRNKIIELLLALLSGDTKLALNILDQFCETSTDIPNLLNDLLKILHITSLAKTIPSYKPHNLSSSQQQTIKEISQKTTLVDLTRIWQMLLKGVNEVSNFVGQKMIAEMLIIRICHLSDLPNLEQIIASSKNEIIHTSKIKNDKQSMAEEIIRNFPQAEIVS